MFQKSLRDLAAAAIKPPADFLQALKSRCRGSIYKKSKMADLITIYCDGGSRGNPGPAGIGVVIEQGVGNLKSGAREYSKYLGKATNNEAEYQAVIFGIKKVKHLIGGEKAEKAKVEVRMDSELVVNQLNGKYKIKEKSLIPFFIEIWNLKIDFGDIKFKYIPREENKKADWLVNRELDSRNSLFDKY